MPYIPSQARSIVRAVAQVQARDPQRKVVILAENSMLGIVALKLGRDENRAKIPPVLGLNVVPLTWESVDTGPFGTGLPPDSTPSGQASNKMLHSLVRNFALKKAPASMRRHLVDGGADELYVPGAGAAGSEEQELYFGFKIVYTRASSTRSIRCAFQRSSSRDQTCRPTSNSQAGCRESRCPRIFRSRRG